MDKLTEMFNDWLSNNPSGDLFQAFQGGLTAGAVSMRDRAMACLDAPGDNPNDIKNAIGSLSDIPQ